MADHDDEVPNVQLIERIRHERNRATHDMIRNHTLSFNYSPEHSSNEQLNCVICLTSFEMGVGMLRLPCVHLFHEKCVEKWLLENRRCPICRNPICEGIYADSEPVVIDGTEYEIIDDYEDTDFETTVFNNQVIILHDSRGTSRQGNDRAVNNQGEQACNADDEGPSNIGTSQTPNINGEQERESEQSNMENQQASSIDGNLAAHINQTED